MRSPLSPALRRLLPLVATLLLASPGLQAQTAAQEAAIRKNLAERLQGMPPIDEIRRTPVAGIFEVRMGQDIVYTDADGSHLLQGQLIDTKNRRNLTEERLDKLSAISFESLPLKDAAVFEDPNCGYCKRFERDMQKVGDVTVYLFLIPILGGDSPEKTRNVWCAKDKAKAWNDLMVADRPAPKVMGECDSTALQRNLEFARKHRITGTPTLIFANGKRVPGAIAPAQVEQLLAEAR